MCLVLITGFLLVLGSIKRNHHIFIPRFCVQQIFGKFSIIVKWHLILRNLQAPFIKQRSTVVITLKSCCKLLKLFDHFWKLWQIVLDSEKFSWKMANGSLKINFHGIASERKYFIFLNASSQVFCQCLRLIHCVKSVQTRSFFWSLFSGIRTEYGEMLRFWTIFTQWFFPVIMKSSLTLSY